MLTKIPGTSDTSEPDDEIFEDIELEAKFVAGKIKKLIDSKFKVYDNKIQEFRDIQLRDIVILLRSTKNKANVFEKELQKQNIDVYSDTSDEYLESYEIQIIMDLLKIIDNPYQELPLVHVMRSAIGMFTDDDLLEIRLADKTDDFYTAMLKARLSVDENLKYKIDTFLEKIEKWREQNNILDLDELIWTIYEDTGFLNYVALMPNGEFRIANLKILFERAKQYETASFKGLFNFIQFIEKIKIGSGDLGAAKIISENENVVRIMSIHKSKGLEFPVVFLAGTGSSFNMMDLNQEILLHQDIGIGVKYIDYDKQIKYDEEIIKSQDYALWYDVIKNNGVIDCLPEIVLRYRVHDGQISQATSNQMMYSNMVTKKALFDFLGEVKEDTIKLHCSIADGIPEYNKMDYIHHFSILRQRNVETKAFDQKEFNNQLSCMWFRLCIKRFKYKHKIDFLISRETLKCVSVSVAKSYYYTYLRNNKVYENVKKRYILKMN